MRYSQLYHPPGAWSPEIHTAAQLLHLLKNTNAIFNPIQTHTRYSTENKLAIQPNTNRHINQTHYSTRHKHTIQLNTNWLLKKNTNTHSLFNETQIHTNYSMKHKHTLAIQSNTKTNLLFKQTQTCYSTKHKHTPSIQPNTNTNQLFNQTHAIQTKQTHSR